MSKPVITPKMVDAAMATARGAGIQMPYSASIRDFPNLEDLRLEDMKATSLNYEAFYNMVKAVLTVDDTEPYIWCWSPQHGPEMWSSPFMTEEQLAHAMTKLEQDARDGWKSEHIYFFATIEEMGPRVRTDTEHVIQYRDVELTDGDWEDEYTITQPYLNSSKSTPEEFYEAWILNQIGEYRLVKRVTERRIADTIIKKN